MKDRTCTHVIELAKNNVEKASEDLKSFVPNTTTSHAAKLDQLITNLAYQINEYYKLIPNTRIG